MKILPSNPPSNQLSSGVTESDVSAAISASGYPLQVIVAQQLQQNGYYVQQEWSYIDSDSGTLRAIDALASKLLWDYEKGQPRVRPELALVVECKQSPLPYVFFSSGKPRLASHFPFLAGLRFEEIAIATDGDRSTWAFSPLSALSLEGSKFILSSPPYASNTFSKCVRKGSSLELSGSDIYSTIVLPLLKCLRHFKEAQKPVETAYYFDLHITVPVAVIDAPLVVVELQAGDKHELTLTPWVRLYRHEYFSAAQRFDREQILAIDVVHKDFLQTYLAQHLELFAQELAAGVIKHAEVFAEGEGFVAGMTKEGWREIEKRLQPVPEGEVRPRARREGKLVAR